MMARQLMSRRKTIKLRERTGLPVIAVLVRGDTNHRKDLCLDDGSVVGLYPDGELVKMKFGHSIKSVI
jgi:hypothetical protein